MRWPQPQAAGTSGLRKAPQNPTHINLMSTYLYTYIRLQLQAGASVTIAST